MENKGTGQPSQKKKPTQHGKEEKKWAERKMGFKTKKS